MAQMNDLLVVAGDVGNAFLYGKTREKVYIIAGPEFGENAGKRLLVYKSLYGLKTSSARFHEHLSEKLRRMGYKPSKADPDLWMTKVGDHYEYIARFVDDIISFSKDPMRVMNELKLDYVMKGVGEPEYYLGGNVEQLGDEWEKEEINLALSARTYVENATKKIAEMCGQPLIRKWKTPMADDYHPELDTSDLCNAEKISKFRSIIGSANWVITLGRFDVAYATSTLARYPAEPREGHFVAAQRIFGYLRSFPDGKLIIDPGECPVRRTVKAEFHDTWSEFYPDAEEELPPDMPEPRGRLATITAYVDADHAHDQVTRRLVTGILLLINNTPMAWISKRQKTVETSTYGSELVAARIATELVMAMRYKLCMLGVELEKTSLMLGDNMSVILNTTLPSSMLKKKHNAIAYHCVREAIAAKIISFVHVSSQDNLADVLTKPLGAVAFHRLLDGYVFRNAKSTKPKLKKD